MKPPTNIFCIDSATEDFFLNHASRLVEPSLTGCSLSENTVVSYRQLLYSLPLISKWKDIIFSDLRCRDGARGYVILDIGPLFNHPRRFDILTTFLTYIGTPFKIFDQWDLWKPINTNLEIEPMRAGGTGLNPLHIDFVNSTDPPDYSCLLCVNEDPMGGGANTISNVRAAVAALTDSERELLKQPVFREGKFFNLSGIGKELNPFPILEMRPTGHWLIRYTGKMTAEVPNELRQLAVKHLGEILIENQEPFYLKRGQLLITNQNIVCHGRLALGAGQEQVPSGTRRELRQIFLRDFPTPF